MPELSVGQVFTHERSFTDEEVLTFLRLSGDAGAHHAAPDASGRRMVHGLLVAAIPTKLGGDINFLARDMQFEFLRPVYTGDTVRCEITLTEVDRRPGRVRLAFTGACQNQHGELVMRVSTRGVVRD